MKQSSLSMLDLIQRVGVLRFMAVMGGTILLSLIFLGLGFMLLILGISMCMLYLAPYWEPAYQAVTKVMGQKDTTGFTPAPLHGLRIPDLLIRLGLWGLLAAYGVWVILQKGFCGQSLFCLLLSA